MGTTRLEVWALPRGAEAYPLPSIAKWSVSPRDDEAGILELTLPANGRNYDRLSPIVDADIDLEVEASLIAEDGRAWRYNFLLDEADLDDVDETNLGTFRGLDITVLFDEAVVPYHPTGEQGETASSGTAGRIARDILGAARTRGCLAGITWTFTDSHDSRGVPWARQGSVRFSPGQTARAVLGTVRGFQLAEWRLTADRELVLVNVSEEADGYGLGDDLTTGANPLTLEHGRDLGDAPRKWRVRDAITALVTAGKDGLYSSAEDPSARARLGRRKEAYHSFNNADDKGTLDALTQRRLVTQTRGKTEVSHKIVLSSGAPTPLIDYRPADRLYSATRNGVAKRRVRQITIDGDSDQAVTCSVTCGDLLDDAAVRQQERIDALASGEAGVGTSVTPPDVDDGSIPAAPENLAASSLWYSTGDGSVGAAAIIASWSAVPDARVQSYAVEWRYPGTMTGWDRIATDKTSAQWSGLRVASTVEVRAYAVNKWGRLSAPSASVTLVTEADGTPPPVLSTPAAFPSLGLIIAGWDGRGSSGEAMPGDFLRAEVHISRTAGFTAHRPLHPGTKRLDEKTSTTYAGELRANGELPIDIGVAGYGITFYVVLVPVDRTGNANTQSAQASVVARPVQDGEIAELGVGKLRTGILTAIVGVAGRLYAGNPNGAGWEAEASGFRFYGMVGGVRTALLEFTAATASLLLRGQFEALGDGQAAISIIPGGQPTMYLSSRNGAFGSAFLNAVDVPDVSGYTGLGINSGPSSLTSTLGNRRGSRVYLRPDAASFEVVDGLQRARGGGVFLGTDRNDARLFDSAGTLRADLSMVQGNGAPGSVPSVELSTYNSGGTRTAFVRLFDGSLQLLASNGLFLNNKDFSTKSFVIPHPSDSDRWLVHGCTESPTAGVEYSGTVLVEDAARVELPPYFEGLVDEAGRTVQLTPVDDGGPLCRVAAGPVRNGGFVVRTDADGPVEVHWHVRGTRRDTAFEVEPLRADYDAHGDGPYRYLTPRRAA